MRRREFNTLLGGAIVLPLTAGAQQVGRKRRVGILMGIPNDAEAQARVSVFRQALGVLGWTEGRNIQFNYRWSASDVAEARQFVTELLDLQPDVLLANSRRCRGS